MIHKLYVGLTSCNHYFYPNKSWPTMHHSCWCRLKCAICSPTVTLSCLNNVARPSKNRPAGPLMFICLSRECKQSEQPPILSCHVFKTRYLLNIELLKGDNMLFYQKQISKGVIPSIFNVYCVIFLKKKNAFVLVSFPSSSDYVQWREQVKAATRAARKSEKQKWKSASDQETM